MSRARQLIESSWTAFRAISRQKRLAEWLEDNFAQATQTAWLRRFPCEPWMGLRGTFYAEQISQELVTGLFYFKCALIWTQDNNYYDARLLRFKTTNQNQ